MARSRRRKKGKNPSGEPQAAAVDAAPRAETPPRTATPRKPAVELPVFDLEERETMRLSFKQRHLLRKALLAVAALGVPALFFVWKPGFPGAETAEVAVKAVFAVSILALVLAREFTPSLRRGRAGAALVIAAILGVGIYFNLGAFHGHAVVHYWEQFHYTLGAKYFPELGHDGLYAASIEAQRVSYPDQPVQSQIRDLRTNVIMHTDAPESAAHRREVRERFSAERWRDFVTDHRHFLDANSRGYLAGIRRDHGFNPPPPWTFMARLFAGWPTLDRESLTLLGMIDMAILLTLFVAIFKTYGARLGCVALAFFGANYAGRYYWVGGGLLREDWLAAVVIGICLLERRRFRWAGALFGYATAVRVFPVLFLFGPAVLALRALLRRERPRWIFDLGVGFALSLTVALAAGCLVGRGPAAWTDFAEAISLHRGTWLTNNVGLDNVLLYGPETYELKLVNPTLPDPRTPWKAHMDQTKVERRPVLLAVKALLLLVLAAAVWRMDLARSAMLGFVVVFVMVLTTCYYWQMLLLAPLLRDRFLLYGVFAINLGLYGLHFTERSFEMRYGVLSWALLVLFVAYLAPKAWATFRSPTEVQEPATA
ncbi:MAG: glycosyltransferase family 87 protein [Acidobacteriota bacterium]